MLLLIVGTHYMVTIKKAAQYALFSDDRNLDIPIEDFIKENPALKEVSFPDAEDERTLPLSARLLELLAIRLNQEPPFWTSTIGEMTEPFCNQKRATRNKRLTGICLIKSPEPLKK